VAHEMSHYGNDGYLAAKERVLGDWWTNKCHWWAAVMDMNESQILSSASATLLAREDIRTIMSRDDCGPKSFGSYYQHVSRHTNELPVLYISSIIISNRMHAPYLFKALSRDLKAAQKEWEMTFDHCLSIALNKKSKFLLEHHGFKSIGLCRGKYPVYQAHRKESPIINALLG